MTCYEAGSHFNPRKPQKIKYVYDFPKDNTTYVYS